ncbi:S-layer homology domain-containing protein, partial [Halalkalibacterium ligniniphilum]
MRSIKYLALLFVILSMLIPTVATGQERFTDVGSDYWAKTEIEFLAHQSIIGGYNDGTFKPSNNVTRAQAAIMIAAALNLDLEN